MNFKYHEIRPNAPTKQLFVLFFLSWCCLPVFWTKYFVEGRRCVLLKFHAKIKVKTPTYNFEFFWPRHVYDKNRFYLWNTYNILQTLSQKEQVANKQSYGLCRRSLKAIQIEKMNWVCIPKYSWLCEWYCIQLESWTFKIFQNW